MTFRVTILGSGSATPTLKRNPTAHALNVHEQFFLIDCGEGTQLQMRKAGINPLKINNIFISHLHGDHIFGIFGIISTMGLQGRKTPLNIYAPRPFDEIIANHLRYFDSQLPFEVQWHEVRTREHNKIFENKVMEVYSIPLRHRIPASGFLFKEKPGYGERSYAFLSDTLPSPRAAELIKGVGTLYHEATFMEADKVMAKNTGHTTALQAAKIALKAEAKHLLIGHFSSRYKDEAFIEAEARTAFPNCDAVADLQSYEIR